MPVGWHLCPYLLADWIAVYFVETTCSQLQSDLSSFAVPEFVEFGLLALCVSDGFHFHMGMEFPGGDS